MPLTLNASRYRWGFTILLEYLWTVCFVLNFAYYLAAQIIFLFFFSYLIERRLQVSGESCKTPLQSSRVVTSAFLLHGILLVWCMPKMDRRYGVTLLYTIFNPASVLLF
jgi:hypothetical protein